MLLGFRLAESTDVLGTDDNAPKVIHGIGNPISRGEERCSATRGPQLVTNLRLLNFERHGLSPICNASSWKQASQLPFIAWSAVWAASPLRLGAAKSRHTVRVASPTGGLGADGMHDLLAVIASAGNAAQQLDVAT
jgi:hypothetical protein